jgi:hypothetical protein
LTKDGWIPGERGEDGKFYSAVKPSNVLLSIRNGATEIDGQLQGQAWTE